MQAFKKCLHKPKALELICFHPRTALKSNFSNQYILIRYTVYIRHTYNADVCVIRSKWNCRVHTLQLRLLARNKRELSGPIKCEKGHHKPLWLYSSGSSKCTVNMGVSLISARQQSDFRARWPFISKIELCSMKQAEGISPRQCGVIRASHGQMDWQGQCHGYAHRITTADTFCTFYTTFFISCWF